MPLLYNAVMNILTKVVSSSLTNDLHALQVKWKVNWYLSGPASMVQIKTFLLHIKYWVFVLSLSRNTRKMYEID